MDPKTGAIVALYGGAGCDNKHFTNNADTTGVPVGSTFKPFVLAAAMEYGTPETRTAHGHLADSMYNGQTTSP